MMGDFNVYSHLEGAYQTYLNYSNPSLRFHDPVDQYGNWHNNADYSAFHTQSTHTSSNGCASTGGMDDRFDFILISNNIKDGTKSVHYLENSYWAVGQDGLRFNRSLNSTPTNTSVPPDILNALYHNSDHLPVMLNLYIDKTLGVNDFKDEIFAEIRMTNPANTQLNLTVRAKKQIEAGLEVYNVFGHLLFQEDILLYSGENKISRSISYLKPGFYIVRLSDHQFNAVSLKLLKN